MAFTLRKAARRQLKSKIGFTGPSGVGKTFSALLLAYGLTSWDKIAVIDTEGSADKYADHPMLGPFLVINLKDVDGPDKFSPNAFIQAMKACIDAGIEVVIIDSATHEWQWCLDYQTKLGGRFQDWAKVTPEHKKFIEAILRCPTHVIVCMRRKTDYAINQEQGKRTTVEKVGLKSEMREGFEYELDLLMGLNQNHMVTIEKDRTGIFANRPDFIITPKIGEEIKNWANGASEHGGQNVI
jgi:hypothetical protein